MVSQCLKYPMKLDKFISDVASSIEDVEPGMLDAETEYKQLKSWDSLAVLTVTDTVEMEYGVLLRKSDFEAASTLSHLFERVCEKLSR